jgi:segregation and condensation protein A
MYEVKIENIFEGPMDLLVYLIRKNEVDIYDIPIAIITEQYLAYLDMMRSMNIDIAGEFMVMAATLTQIKSKMLLPVHDGEDAEDPRMELARPLREYMQLRSLAEELGKRQLLGEDVFVREPDKEELTAQYQEDFVRVGLFELIDAFQRILDNLPIAHIIDFSEEKISIKDRITEIVDILENQGSVAFHELFASDFTKNDMITTFLAILEMSKLNLIRITQHLQTGIIRLFYL